MTSTLAEFIKSFHILHGIISIGLAFGFFYFWGRTGFWVPKYVHFIGLIALFIGMRMSTMVSSDAPIMKYGELGNLFIILILPLMVYFFFIFFGGQREAYEYTYSHVITCPRCSEQVHLKNNKGSRGVGALAFERCNNCGNEFNLAIIQTLIQSNRNHTQPSKPRDLQR